MEYDKTAAGAPIGSIGCRCFVIDVSAVKARTMQKYCDPSAQREACARRRFVRAVGIAPYAKKMEKQKLRKPSPLGEGLRGQQA